MSFLWAVKPVDLVPRVRYPRQSNITIHATTKEGVTAEEIGERVEQALDKVERKKIERSGGTTVYNK